MKAFRLLILAIALACATSAHAQKKQNGFSVVLLIGQTWGPSSLDGLPPTPGLQKALDDVKDFLPYKSYKLLDTQWMRSGMSRMKGVDEQEYEVTVEAGEFTRQGTDLLPYDPSSGKPALIVVNFRLREAGAVESSPELSRQLDKVRMLTDQAKEQLAAAHQKYEQTHPAVKGAETTVKKYADEAARLEQQLRRTTSARKLLDSHFEMASGETVVVGTSKIGGDKGLVVLLTAIK